MPWDQVMSKFKKGKLQSGGHGKGFAKVKSRKQAIAIMLSEKAKAAGNSHFASKAAKKVGGKK